ncbi:inorganic diphosphatase [Beijerinckia indica]|uniref:inorganic diphosphatase n=1 Tax=Beijerinckia indica subsp. indica (strain ATCC 9039 / DSM 1715 / NCIMB 8712) TaxID=395963 RepID=B2IL12_BEII9|nr:inorganic diphosphatase [Beijerinckia indica]ACB96552.1 Inorganic pyrophosphatase [Beijerinckia indica subsp. indica ATCC 9039]
MLSRVPADLSSLPSRDPETGDLLAIIETPRGSRNKYAYDPAFHTFRLKNVLPKGSVFPYDFGFIPSTKADDDDPVDVLVLLDEEIPVGCAITVRLIGAIEAEQRKHGKEWIRNDRLIAIASHAHLHGEVESLKEINPRLIQEIEEFFIQYEKLSGKDFRIVGRCGPKSAQKLLEAGAQRWAKNPTATCSQTLLSAEKDG